jgi:hypothetical protein
MVTSGISRYVGAQSFGGAHRGRACVRVFIGVSILAYCERLRCTVYFFLKKSCNTMYPSNTKHCRYIWMIVI